MPSTRRGYASRKKSKVEDNEATLYHFYCTRSPSLSLSLCSDSDKSSVSSTPLWSLHNKHGCWLEYQPHKQHARRNKGYQLQLKKQKTDARFAHLICKGSGNNMLAFCSPDGDSCLLGDVCI